MKHSGPAEADAVNTAARQKETFDQSQGLTKPAPVSLKRELLPGKGG
jgi:hypothetical protein